MNRFDYLQVLLKKKNIMVKDVAKKIGVSENIAGKKVKGLNPLKLTEIDIILEMLDMSFDNVFGKKNIEITEKEVI